MLYKDKEDKLLRNYYLEGALCCLAISLRHSSKINNLYNTLLVLYLFLAGFFCSFFNLNDTVSFPRFNKDNYYNGLGAKPNQSCNIGHGVNLTDFYHFQREM